MLLNLKQSNKYGVQFHDTAHFSLEILPSKTGIIKVNWWTWLLYIDVISVEEK